MSTKTFNFLNTGTRSYSTASDPGATVFTISETGTLVYATTVTVALNAITATINLKGSGDTINLSGNFADYTVRFAGKTATFTSATQTISVVMSSLANGFAINNTINFDDASFSLTKPSNSSVVYLNNDDDEGYQLARQKLGTTAAPINSIVLTAEIAGGPEDRNEHKDANEGDEVVYRIYTNGIPAGTSYNYTLTGINANDLVDGALTGTVILDENGYAELAFSLNEDFRSENLEYMKLSVAGQQITVDVVDTSQNLPVALQANKTDVIIGTAFNDVILGEISPGSSSYEFSYGYAASFGWELNSRPEFRTLNNSDIIRGLGGQDTFKLSVSSGYAEAHIDMQDVETLSIHATQQISNEFFGFFGAGENFVNLDLSNVSGLDNVDVYGTQNIDILLLQNVKEIFDLSLHGNGNYSGTNVVIEYDPEVVAGDNDAMTIDVDRFRGDINPSAFNGIEHLSITSSYDSQPGEFSGQERDNDLYLNLGEDATVTTLAINSEQNLDLNINNADQLLGINGAGSSGELDINVDDAENFEFYYGSSGDDELRLYDTRANDENIRLEEAAADNDLEDLHIELGRGDNYFYAEGDLDDVYIKGGGGVDGGEDEISGVSNASDNEIVLDADYNMIVVSANDDCGPINDYSQINNYSVGDVTIDLKYAIGEQNIFINKAIYEVDQGNNTSIANDDTAVRADDTSNDLTVWTGGATSTTNIDVTGTSFDNNYMLGNFENLYIYSDETLSDINLFLGHGDQNINVQSNGDVNITVGDGSNEIKVDGFSSWDHKDATPPTPYNNTGEDSYTVFGPNDDTYAQSVIVNVGHGNRTNNNVDLPYEEDNAILGAGNNTFIIHANDDITINVRDYRTDDVNDNDHDTNINNGEDDAYVWDISDQNIGEETGLDINLSFVASETGDITVNVGEVASGTTDLRDGNYDEILCTWVDGWIEDVNTEIDHDLDLDTNIHASRIDYTNTSNAKGATNINMGDLVMGQIELGQVGEDAFIEIDADIDADTRIHSLTAYNGSDINIQLANMVIEDLDILKVDNEYDNNEVDIDIDIDVDSRVTVENLEVRSTPSLISIPGLGLPPANNATISIAGAGQTIGEVTIGDITFRTDLDRNNQDLEVDIEQDIEDTLDINNIYAEDGLDITTAALLIDDISIASGANDAIESIYVGTADNNFTDHDVEVQSDINQNININNVSSEGDIYMTFGGFTFGNIDVGDIISGAGDMDIDVIMDTNRNIDINNVEGDNVSITMANSSIGTVDRDDVTVATSDNFGYETEIEIKHEIDMGLDVNDINANSNISIQAASLSTGSVTLGNLTVTDSDYNDNNNSPDYNLNANVELDVNDLNANGDISVTGLGMTLGNFTYGNITYKIDDQNTVSNFDVVAGYDVNIDINANISDLNANGNIDINLGAFSRGDVTVGNVMSDDLDAGEDSNQNSNVRGQFTTDVNINIDINDINANGDNGDIDITVGGITTGDISTGRVISEGYDAELDVNEDYDVNIDINDLYSYGNTHITVRDFTFGAIDAYSDEILPAAYADTFGESDSYAQLDIDRNVNVNINISDINADGNITVSLGDITIGDLATGETDDGNINANANIDLDDNLDFNIDIDGLDAFDNFGNGDITIETGDIFINDRINDGNDADFNSNINVDINIDDIDADGRATITTGGYFYNNDSNSIGIDGNENDSIDINIDDVWADDGLDITINASTDLDINLTNNVGSLTTIDVRNSYDVLINVGNEEDNITLESAYWNRINNISANDDVGVEDSNAWTDIEVDGDWTASSATYNKNANTTNTTAASGRNDTVISTKGGYNVDLRNATTSGDDGLYYGFRVEVTENDSGSEIWGSNLDDRINDGGGNNILRGMGGNDTISAGAGNDTLDGGVGNDDMTGGDGDDIYYVDQTNDTITEGSGGSSGNDTVYSRVTFDLSTNAVNVENLTLTGPNDSTNDTDAINGTGNSSANVITGNNGNNTLNGGAGNDTIYGGAGNDTIDGGADDDNLFGGAGDDLFTGGLGSDIFNINGGNDDITDITNDDTVKVEDNGNLDVGIVTGDWTATAASYNKNNAEISSAGHDVDLNLVTGPNGWIVRNTGGAATFTGSDFNDSLYGGTANDTLNGGAGNDTIDGGGGNDAIDGGNGNDTLTGGGGIDTFTVGSGTNEQITDLGNGGADILNVTSSGVSVYATASDDWTATNDTNNAGNVYISSAGYDIDLSADTSGSTRGYSVTATSSAAVTFSGSSLADNLTGNSGNDTLNGGDGGDTLNGGGGSDTINGGDGADTIIGGEGNDTMTGGTGVDTFSFSTADLDTSFASAGITDVITDFTPTDGERIGGWGVAGSVTNYLENDTVVDFNTLKSNADAALNGTVRYYVGVTATDAYLIYDQDGNGMTDIIKLQGVTDLNAIDQFSIVA